MNHDCIASLAGDELLIANRQIERRWRIVDGSLRAISFLDRRSGRQWCAKPATVGSFATTGAAAGVASLRSTFGRRGPTEAESLVAELSLGPARWTLQIFPDGAGVTVQRHAVDAAVAAPDAPADGPTGVERDPQAGNAQTLLDTLDVLAIDPLHCTLTHVVLRDQTDVHDNLVQETTYQLTPVERTIELAGNVFFLEHRLTGDGLLCVKHAPLPHARPIQSPVDCRLRGDLLAFLGHGSGYASTLISYVGGRSGRIAAIHQLQRQLRVYHADRDGLLLSNTWGDRNRDGRISESFMLEEVAAGEKLGVDVVQIDDGWQRGVTANSVEKGGVWESFWASDPQFWTPHPTRFPHGLSDVLQSAKDRGMKFGLWFAPDSGDEFANWRKDADTLLGFYREQGVTHFKLDGIKSRTVRGEANLQQFFAAVLKGSDGAITMDLDVTAEVRPGYFGAMAGGPLFVENRYTDWHRYWPHQTLRNFWLLAQYVNPVRLRMEFLNHTRNPDKYPNDPLAPANYRADYLFASVMFGSPLGWFEVSNLPGEFAEQVRPLVALWKRHRQAIFANQTTPIGHPPDGTAWTGFLNLASDGRSGYALVFRELNERGQWSLDLPAGDWQAVRLAGEGEAKVIDERLVVSIDKPLRFVWLQIQQLAS